MQTFQYFLNHMMPGQTAIIKEPLLNPVLLAVRVPQVGRVLHELWVIART